MAEVNWIAVVVAAVSAFVLGGLWYSPMLLGKAWMRESGWSESQAGHPGMVYGGALLLSFLAAAVFAMFLGPDINWQFGLGAGLAAGLFWVAGSLGINYLFEAKSLKLWMINGGYHVFQFALYGLILGLWN